TDISPVDVPPGSFRSQRHLIPCGTRACGRPDGRILVIKEWLVTDGTEHTRSSGELSDQRSAQYVVGVDYGTLSGRAVVVRVSDGSELGSAVVPYAHGVLDRTLAATGRRLPPDWALQVPSDYVDVL